VKVDRMDLKHQPLSFRTCHQCSVVVFWFAIRSSDLTNTRHACYLAVWRFSCHSRCQVSLQLLTSMVRILFNSMRSLNIKRCKRYTASVFVFMTFPTYLHFFSDVDEQLFSRISHSEA